jgi:outer membrane protein assembly factor BamB
VGPSRGDFETGATTYDTTSLRLSGPEGQESEILRRGRVVRVVAFLLALSACSTGKQGYRLAEGESYSPLPPITAPGDAAQAWTADWPMYQFDLSHGSRNLEADAITSDNVAGLARAWQWLPDPPSEEGQPSPQLLASPAVFDGRVYIGANTGVFYAIDATNGTVVWQRPLGYVTGKTCSERGITSSAALARDGEGDLVVFVGGGDGNIYALRADDGSVIWQASVVEPGEDENEGYIWSSPAVAGGRVYIGVSSQCGSPQIRGGLKAFNQTTGESEGAYWVVPKGAIGGSVWSSPVVSDGDVFVSTGNADPTEENPPGDSYSLVQLDGKSLEKLASWTVPNLGGTDLDFGASASLFGSGGRGMIGACNKNGVFYAFRQDDLEEGPVWAARISADWADGGNCLGGAIWDPKQSRVFVTGGQVVIDGEEFEGSVQALDANTGRPLWQRGLPLPTWGTSSLNGSGILAAPSFGGEASPGNGVYLLEAESGAILTQLDTGGSPVFAQPVFSDRYLFVATQSEGLIAFAAPASAEPN